MKELVPGIFQIDTEAVGQKGLISSYLVKGSEKTALIDPGFPASAALIAQSMKQAGHDPAAIDYIILTHFHLDHSGGTGELLQGAPGARVVCHKRGAFYVKNFAKIVGGAKMVFNDDITKRLGTARMVEADRVVSVDDGDSFDLGGGVKLNVITTPGHTADHISLLEASSGALLAGDMAAIVYPAVGDVLIPAGSPPIFDLDTERASLEKIRGCGAQTMLLPHFGKFNGTLAEFVDRNLEAIDNTQAEVKAMFYEGMEFPQMVQRLRDKVIAEGGTREEDIPEFLRDTWLRLMISTGLMGLMAFMLKYAPYPRPFVEEEITEEAVS